MSSGDHDASQGVSRRAEPPPDEPVRSGQIIAGKYEVERVLGQGGMGVVVAARHLQLGQRVAIKFLLSAGVQDAITSARFLQEARLCVQLQSEYVARVLDVGTLENDAPYMVMEYLHGHDLSAELRRVGPLDAATAVRHTLQACEALAEAHALGIIHRDLKPANLFLVERRDGTRSLKVLDFGIAKLQDPDGGMSLTDSATVLGTPFYMSPEQLQSSKMVDERTDVWSLTMVLYELLTGSVAFPRRTMPELCAAILLDPVPGPDQLNPAVPASLSAVVLRGLEKDVTRRYRSLAELSAALAPFTPDGAASAGRTARTLGLAPGVASAATVPALLSSPAGGNNVDALAATGPSPALGASTGDASTGLSVSSTQLAGPPGRPTSHRSPTVMGLGALVVVAMGVIAVMLTRSAGPSAAGTSSVEPAAPLAVSGSVTATAVVSAAAGPSSGEASATGAPGSSIREASATGVPGSAAPVVSASASARTVAVSGVSAGKPATPRPAPAPSEVHPVAAPPAQDPPPSPLNPRFGGRK